MLKKRWNRCSWLKMLGRLWMTRKISSPGLNILDPCKIAFPYLITDFPVDNHSCPRACDCLDDDDQWIFVDIITIILLRILANIIIINFIIIIRILANINIMIRILANIMDQLGDLGRHAADIMAGIGLRLFFFLFVCLSLFFIVLQLIIFCESDLPLKIFH